MEQNSPAVGAPVEPTVRPRAWAVDGNCIGASDGGPALWRREPTAEDRKIWADCGGQATVTPLHERPTPEAVAWAMAEEAGEDPGTLIWEGNPPEPWGEVWCRYMPQAERLVKRLFGA